ncbi:MAG: tryptophan synthase subunit alpha [Flavobacteriales bacterium]|nr:tryptophan synthase subunit alpha [Flavobacteriales bacterium]NQX96926.1 tryptophan synthase subunit alpha [Flavobacteriales bacterium]
MKRVEKLFKEKKNILNIYLTAGYPNLNDTIEVVKELANNGVDMVEIGMPFSDPLADGPTIQNSSQVAIKNGITLELIFNQIEEIRKTVEIPIVLMGYYNQVLQYGADSFFEKAKAVGVDGFIIPDLPLDIYEKEHQQKVESLGLNMIFLITPQTTDERIILIDSKSSGFLYVVSSFAITGSKSDIQQSQIDYFKRINNLKLKNPKLIGFGISDKKTFDTACQHAEGAIIGSAFIKAFEGSKNIKQTVKEFITTVL